MSRIDNLLQLSIQLPVALTAVCNDHIQNLQVELFLDETHCTKNIFANVVIEFFKVKLTLSYPQGAMCLLPVEDRVWFHSHGVDLYEYLPA